MPSRRAVILAYLRLPHALPVLVVLLTTAVLIVVIDGGFPLIRGTAILLAMLGAQLVIGVVNEVVDRELDLTARPDKPLVSGLVSVRGAYLMLFAACGLMVAAGLSLGWDALAICLLGCGIGVAYSLWFKRTILASLPYLVALPLLPIWIAVALDEFEPAWLLAYPLGWCAILGVQIAQSVPDVASDRAAGIVSLTTFLGERRSLAVCWAALAVSALFFASTGIADDAGLFAAIGVAGGVLGNAVVYRARPRSGARLAFPIAAAGTAALGIVWVLALRSS